MIYDTTDGTGHDSYVTIPVITAIIFIIYYFIFRYIRASATQQCLKHSVFSGLCLLLVLVYSTIWNKKVLKNWMSPYCLKYFSMIPSEDWNGYVSRNYVKLINVT